jgi:prophage maintenance system killer protein
MEFYDRGLEREYKRWLAAVGDDDPYRTRSTVGLHDVLRAHFLILDYFSQEKQGQGVGGVGPKDLNLLHSALFRQFTSFGGKEKWPLPLEKCATLLYGIVKDHPFHDANKRTGFLTTLLFLERIGRVPRIKQKEFEDFVVEVADDQLGKYSRFRDAQARSPDPEITFIADYLKRNTRDVDHQTYTITFHELNGVLRPRGFELASPSGNFIDVIKVEHRPKYLGLIGPKVRVETRLAQVGFPGWKRQVTRAALKTVREATGLIAQNGFDSKVFYQGADPLHALIDTYAEPLRRLADR